MNRTLAAMKPYTTKQISKRAQRDPEIVNLSIGEPWFGPAPFAGELLSSKATGAALASRSCLGIYSGGRGNIHLRQQIAMRYKLKYGLEFDPERNVLVTPGGSTGFALAVLSLTEPGDDVLIPDPSYMLYENTCALLGRNAVRVRKGEDEEFILSVDAILEAKTPKSKMLVVNSPENPTGAVHSRAELQEISSVCRREDIALLHDEVYDSFVFDGEHVPCGTFDPSLHFTLQLNSMSKRFGLPGLRIGWLIGSNEVIDLAERALEYLCLSVGGMSQYMGEMILTEPSTQAWTDSIAEQIRVRRDFMTRSLESCGFRFSKRGGAGALFLFPNITAAARRAGISGEGNIGERFANWLLDEVKVAVVPGGVYGSSGVNHVRIVTAVDRDRISLAAARIADCLG